MIWDAWATLWNTYHSVAWLFHCFTKAYFNFLIAIFHFYFISSLRSISFLSWRYFIIFLGVYFISSLAIFHCDFISFLRSISFLSWRYFIFHFYFIVSLRPVSYLLGRDRGKILPKKVTIEHICRTLNIQKSCDYLLSSLRKMQNMWPNVTLLSKNPHFLPAISFLFHYLLDKFYILSKSINLLFPRV